MTNGDPPDIFAGTNPEPVTRGATLTIDVAAPGLANQSIKVTITDAEGFDDIVEIQLNENGEGAIEWEVPTGTGPSLFLDHESSATHTVTVVDPT